MKKLCILLITVFSIVNSYAQTDTIRMKSGFWGIQFIQDKKKLNFGQVVALMEPNAEAYKLIRSARTNNTWSGVLSGIGGFLIGWPVGTAIGGGDPEWAMAAAGAGLVVASIPFTVAANKKSRAAIDTYNLGLKSTGGVSEPKLFLNFTGSSAGIALHF